jgi:hypothetical protein
MMGEAVKGMCYLDLEGKHLEEGYLVGQGLVKRQMKKYGKQEWTEGVRKASLLLTGLDLGQNLV